MEIKKIDNQKIWNDFVTEHGPRSGAFLHSWEWGEYLLSMGDHVRRLGLHQKDKLEAVACLIENQLPAGKKNLYCPRGPIASALWYVGDLVQSLEQYTQDQGAMFIRFDCPVEGSGKLSGSRFVKTVTIQPKQTLQLDLSKDAERLLAEMHHKTRYNIRLAAKKEIKIEVLGADQFDQAWPVFEQTAERDKFRLHDQDHYKQMIKSLGSMMRLVVAKHENEIIAAVIMIDFAGVRTYLHGASSNKHRNLMAPYAIHWHEIQDAIKQGYEYYDFWGVSDTNPAWKGITRFKRGFGGTEIEYPGTFDYVINKPQYLLYKIARRLRYGSRH